MRIWGVPRAGFKTLRMTGCPTVQNLKPHRTHLNFSRQPASWRISWRFSGLTQTDQSKQEPMPTWKFLGETSRRLGANIYDNRGISWIGSKLLFLRSLRARPHKTDGKIWNVSTNLPKWRKTCLDCYQKQRKSPNFHGTMPIKVECCLCTGLFAYWLQWHCKKFPYYSNTFLSPQLDLHTIKMFGYSDTVRSSPVYSDTFLLSKQCHCKRGGL